MSKEFNESFISVIDIFKEKLDSLHNFQWDPVEYSMCYSAKS